MAKARFAKRAKTAESDLANNLAIGGSIGAFVGGGVGDSELFRNEKKFRIDFKLEFIPFWTAFSRF